MGNYDYDLEFQKEPSEVRILTLSFEDVLDHWEDIESATLQSYRLTGTEIDRKIFELDGNYNQFICQVRRGGKIETLASINVTEKQRAILKVYTSLDPVEDTSIWDPDSLIVHQKSVQFTTRGGEDLVDYLLNIHVISTTKEEYDKEVLIQVRAEP